MQRLITTANSKAVRDLLKNNFRVLLIQVTARVDPIPNYSVKVLYHRRTRRARRVFQRLALPTAVSICNGIRSG